MKIIGPLGLLMTMVHLTQLLLTMSVSSVKSPIRRVGCGWIIIRGPIPMNQIAGCTFN